MQHAHGQNNNRGIVLTFRDCDKSTHRHCGQVEIGNSKQIRISNDKMTKTNILQIRCFCHWNIRILVIVSDFVLQISKFLSENKGFRSNTKCDVR